METRVNHRRIIREEHITLLKEVGSVFIGFITTSAKDANTISASLIQKLNVIKAPLNELRAIGSDGTAVNTGHKEGLITLLERQLSFLLQWLKCMLHFNEIPLKHIIETLYGAAHRPNSFWASVTKELENCGNLPIVDFEIISTDFLDINFRKLSTDHKYLWEILYAISTVECSRKQT